MQKLSMNQVYELVSEAPGVIRKLASERDHYKGLYETGVRHDDAEKTAAVMHQKGINMDTPMADLVANLEKAAEQGKLEQIRAAVDMVGPDMGTKVAQLANDESRITAGSSEFERFIVGGVG